MTLQNTTTNEDKLIKNADNPIFELIAIIERLDEVIEDWKSATECETPEEFERRGE